MQHSKQVDRVEGEILQSQSKKNIPCCPPPPPLHTYSIIKRLCRPVVHRGMGGMALTSAGFAPSCEDSKRKDGGRETRWAVAEQGWGGGWGWGGHCCLQVESLRILLAVETPLREGLDEEDDWRSALALLFRDPPSVPFTQTGLATAGLWSAVP